MRNRRKPVPRDQRGLIDKIRRGEIEHDENEIEKEILLEFEAECGSIAVPDEIVEKQKEERRNKSSGPGHKLNIEQSASVILVKAKDRKDRPNDDDSDEKSENQ